VGGGPSLKTQLEQLRNFRTIIACGSVHDYLIDNDIIPTYAANCDPDSVVAKYYSKPDPEIKYLMASNTSQKVIEALEGQQIISWHCHSPDLQDKVSALEKAKYNRPYQAVCGGCTIGLRSLSIAICLGYSNTHFFGFDSCMGEEDTHHAYKWADEEYESKLLPKIHNIQLGSKEGLIENGKSYRVSGYQLAQLQHFKDFYLNFSNLFTPIFHGEGALPDFYSFIKSMETYQRILNKDSTLVLSTDSELFRLLKRSAPNPPAPPTR
jgi:predicted metal-binding protein